ncbi:MAG: type I-B CRISPR-associated protein Cas8b1/Cst1 [Bacteroidetes bacterium]|nr:type I-B CRISPR-associated protein Cas8b1/Cst1 [Bacteroidota bacterium]
MKQTYKTIDYEWLTRPTGDPFADAGGFAIEYLSEKFPEKDILELIKYVTVDNYISTWKGKLHSYYHGSKITNTSIKTDGAKIEGTMKMFEAIISEIEEAEIGFCRISGRETKLYSLGRESMMLSGSGGFINFHHYFDDGLKMSKEIVIRMFFMPLATILLQGKIALLYSNDVEVVKFWVRDNCSQNLSRIGKPIQDEAEAGALKSEYTRISNALFSFVDKLFTTTPFLKANTSLTLYHCSNFITKSELQIYELPAKVFRFYTTCLQPKYLEDWLFFVRSHYFENKHKGAIYNPHSDLFELVKSKEKILIKNDEFKQWYNVIYNKLLNNGNLRKDFLRWSSKHPLKFEIVSIYQQNIIGMKKETINKIKELAAFLVREEDADKIKKRINALDGVKNASALRRFILKDVVTANYIAGNNDPIVSVDDYVNYLFPDGSYWAEIRDILLIAIYQELHERNLISEELKVELESEAEEEIIND